MTQLIGTLVCIAFVGWMFYLARDVEARPSRALWIPTVWLLIVGSRGVSAWLHPAQAISLAQKFTEGNPLDASIYAGLTVAGALVLNGRSRKVREFFRQNLPLIVFFSYCALSVAWSDVSFIALKRWTKSLGDLVMIMVVLTDPYPLIAIRRVLTRVAFVLLPASVLFIVCFPSLGSSFRPEDGTTMYFGVTTFKNELGMVCMVHGLSSIWTLLNTYVDRNAPNRTGRLFAYGAIVATAIGLIVKADSMTSLSCLGLAGAVMVMNSQRWATRWPKSAHVIVWSAIAVPLFALFLDTVGTLVHSLGRNGTLTGRTEIWKAVLAMHTNPLIGTGFESFWTGGRLERVWNMSVQGIEEAHNGYLEVYLNLGWIGVFLLLWLIVSGYRRAMSTYKIDPVAGRLSLSYFVAAMIYNLTEAGFKMLIPIWFAFLLSITIVPAGLALKEQNESPSLSWVAATGPRRVRILQ
jgi:exopolysaccharide production protein ExoQ